MEVQVLLPAPIITNPNPRPAGVGFGFVVYFDYPNFNLKKNKPNSKTEVKSFSNVDEYPVVSNVTGKPCRIELSGEWTDRRSGVRGRAFDVPENRMIFLKR